MTTNLIDFNLEIALAEPERVVYRNGQKPLEWHYFKTKMDRWNIVTILPTGKSSCWHTSMGRFDDHYESGYDLMLLPKTRKVWVVSWTDAAFRYSTFLDEKDAREHLAFKKEHGYNPSITEVELPY